MIAKNSEGSSGESNSPDIRLAREAAIAYIGIAAKSSGRVRDHLLQKGYGESIADFVVSSLVEDQYISDHKVMDRIVRSRRGRLAESRDRLISRCMAAGVDERVLRDMDLMTDEALMEELFCAMYPEGIREAPSWDERKFQRLMLSRGFSPERVEEWINHIRMDSQEM